MQYLVSVIFDTAGLATPDEMAAIGAFNDRLEAEGHGVFAGGLNSPSTATVIDNRSGEALFTDGPFLETKEYVAGLWIIEAHDPRRGTQARRRGVEGLQSEGRGTAVPRRVSVIAVQEAITARRHLPTRSFQPAFKENSHVSAHTQPAYQNVLERNPGRGVGSGRTRSWEG